jgi:hypothetical protein
MRNSVAIVALLCMVCFVANADTFTFGFTNTQGNVNGTVTGTILLPDGDGTNAATQVTIDSYPAYFAANGYPAPPCRT